MDCGDTVTTDVRLTGHLDCSQESGLTIAADGVDVDLAGYAMNGGIFVGGGGPRAIDNSGGYDDLTVRNGALGAFGEGIFARDASRNRVLDVNVAAAGNAVTLEGGSFNEIRNSDVFGRSWGILAARSDSLLVAGTTAGGAFGSGIDVTGDLPRIVRNEVIRRGGPFATPAGIEFVGSGARIAENRVEGAWNAGIAVTGANNVVIDNVVLRAALPVMGEPSYAGDGIFVGAFSTGAVLRRNRTDENEGDGIEVQATGTRLEGNSANDNGDFGIDVVAGVTDLGVQQRKRKRQSAAVPQRVLPVVRAPGAPLSH